MANTLLRYALTTVPFPLQASPQTGNANVATLMLVVTNETNKGVPLQGILVTLPVGDGAAQLTPTQDVANIGPVSPPGWKLVGTQHPKDGVQYAFQPTGDGTLPSQQSLVFTFNNVTINQQPGPVTVEVMEGSNNCQPPTCPTAAVGITKFPNGWGTVSFWTVPDPPIVPYDSGPTLNWSGPSGATYTIEYYTPHTGIVNVPAPGQPPLSNQGQYPATGQPSLQLEQNTTFYLLVSEVIEKQTYSAQQQVTATVETPPPQICKFTGTIDTSGDTPALVLKWVSNYASYCTLSNNPTQQLTTSSPADGYRLPLTATTPLAPVYTLTAYNTSNQSANSTIKVQWGLLNTVAVSQCPNRLAVSPDGSRLYVGLSNASYDGVTPYENAYLVALDTKTLQVIKTLQMYAANIAVSRDGTKVFVTSTNYDNNLLVIDTTNWSVTSTTLPGIPDSIAVAATGPNTIYVSMGNPGQVLMLDAATYQPVGQPFHVGDQPTALAVSRNGQVLYVVNYNTTSVSLIKTETGTVSTITDPNLQYWFVAPRIAVAPDGGRAYVASNGSHSLVVIDTATEKVVQVLQCSDVPNFGVAVALTGDGMQAFVTACDLGGNNSGVVVVNTATLPAAAVQVLPAQKAPTAVAVAPDNGRFYVANQDSQSVSVFQATLVGGVDAC